jgi:hypothetical protein
MTPAQARDYDLARGNECGSGPMAKKLRVNRFGRALPGLLSFALGACAAATVYHPAGPEGSAGYTDKAMARGHYLVTFTGAQNMALDEVRRYLRRREAEVTIAAGYSHFVVFTTRNEADIRVLPAADSWTAENGFSAGYINKDDSRTVSDDGTPSRPWVGDSIRNARYTAYSDIIVLKGEAAAKNPDAQSAQAILDRMGVRKEP